MTKIDNKKVLTEGLKKAERIIRSHLRKQLEDSFDYVWSALAAHHAEAGWSGWTGSTQLSYMAGIYTRGKQDEANTRVTIYQNNKWKGGIREFRDSKGAYHSQLLEGEWGWIAEPFEGPSRSVQGKVPNSRLKAVVRSRNQLNEHKVTYGNIGAMITTGTLYSSYLENVLGLDVLGRTHEDYKRALRYLFKSLPNK